MTDQPSGEQSQEKRYEGLYAEYAFIGLNDDYRYVDVKNCFLRNFGLTGASIYVYEPVPPDTSVFLRLYHPKNETPIDIICAVTSVTRAGAAAGPNAAKQSNLELTYMNMNDASKRFLSSSVAYLESLAPKKKDGIDYR